MFDSKHAISLLFQRQRVCSSGPSKKKEKEKEGVRIQFRLNRRETKREGKERVVLYRPTNTACSCKEYIYRRFKKTYV